MITLIRITAVLVLVLSGCGDSEPGTSSASANSLSLALKFDMAPPTASEAIVMWSVSSGSPDYVYVWGRADVSGAASTLRLQTRPPTEAVNKYGLGVGVVVIAPRSSQVHDGKQTDADEEVFAQALGASERHAIIFVDRDRVEATLDERAAEATAEELSRAREHWMFDFPDGYSCGEGRDAPPGETFDSFAPVDCDELQIRFDALDDLEFTNWT